MMTLHLSAMIPIWTCRLWVSSRFSYNPKCSAWYCTAVDKEFHRVVHGYGAMVAFLPEAFLLIRNWRYLILCKQPAWKNICVKLSVNAFSWSKAPPLRFILCAKHVVWSKLGNNDCSFICFLHVCCIVLLRTMTSSCDSLAETYNYTVEWLHSSRKTVSAS